MKIMSEEIWIKYEHEDLHESQKFEVSNHGRVKSYNGPKPTILKGYVNNGYDTFSTRKKNKKRTLTYVHKAVAELFVENDDPEKTVVAHKDWDKLNNHADNLVWMTPKVNEQHAYQNPAGSKLDKIMEFWDNAEPNERYFANKLSEAQVLKIKKLVNDPNRKTRIKMIAKQFNVSPFTIFSIKAGRSWDWLTEDYLKKDKKKSKTKNRNKPELGKEFLKNLKKHDRKKT